MHPIFQVGSWCRDKKKIVDQQIPHHELQDKIGKSCGRFLCVIRWSQQIVERFCCISLDYLFFSSIFNWCIFLFFFVSFSLCFSFDLRLDHIRLLNCTNLQKRGMAESFIFTYFVYFSFSLCAFLLFLFVDFF